MDILDVNETAWPRRLIRALVLVIASLFRDKADELEHTMTEDAAA
jgi:hypothetical protein